MKVLVTGGTGLVGQAIKEITSVYRNYEWHFLSSADCDLRDPASTDALFERHYPVHYVIHLAARVGGLYRNMSQNTIMFEENIAINNNVIKSAAKHGVRKAVLCLSTCVYPDKPPSYPFNESSLHQGPPHPSNEGYAYAKRMMEVLARLYNEQLGGPRFLCVSPTNVYGAHDNFNLDDSHVIPGLIHRCYLAKRDNTELVVRGSGQALRQFIHARDLAHRLLLVLFTLEPEAMPHGMIISPSEEHSIADVVNMIADATHLPRERIVYDRSYGDGQYRKTADNSLMERLLPDSPLTSLKDGIEETVKWFAENYEKARK